MTTPPTKEIGEIVLDKHQLAQKLRVSVSTIERWSRTQKIPRLRLGNLVRFEWSAVRQALVRADSQPGPFQHLDQ